MKRVVRYMLVATAIALSYAAWVMIGRYVENRRLEEATNAAGPSPCRLSRRA